MTTENDQTPTEWQGMTQEELQEKRKQLQAEQAELEKKIAQNERFLKWAEQVLSDMVKP